MNKHPFTTYIEPKIAEFEKLTGIKVVMEAFPEDQYRNKLRSSSMPAARWTVS